MLHRFLLRLGAVSVAPPATVRREAVTTGEYGHAGAGAQPDIPLGGGDWFDWVRSRFCIYFRFQPWQLAYGDSRDPLFRLLCCFLCINARAEEDLATNLGTAARH